MEGIKIEVIGNIAKVIEKPTHITSGTIGLPVYFTFDSQWEGLKKVAVFHAGNVKKDTVVVDGTTAVPMEVLAIPKFRLQIGVCGMNEDGSVAIPTIWANLGTIRHGAVPSGNEGSDIGTVKKYYDVAMLAAESSDESARKAEADANEAAAEADRSEAAAARSGEAVVRSEDAALRSEAAADQAEAMNSDLLNQVDLLNQRVENIISTPGGSTEGNAELLDIRVDYDGSVSACAGDAVRKGSKKASDLEALTFGREVPCSFQLENGTISSTGTLSNNGSHIRTANYIDAQYLGQVVGKCSNNKVTVYACEYDADKNFIARYGTKGEHSPKSADCKYVKYVFYSTSVAQADIGQYCDIVYRGANPTTPWLEQSAGFSSEKAMTQNATTNEIDNVARAIFDNNFEITPIWENGLVIGAGGNTATHENSIGSDFIRRLPFGEFVFENIGSIALTIRLIEYDKDKNFISYQAVIDPRLTIKSDDCVYFRLSAQYVGTDYESVDAMKPFVKAYYNFDIYQKVVSFDPNAETIKSINHRGYNSVAPENTLPAFRLSKRHGFDIVECDVAKTKDGVLVLLHDATINRTARNLDGSSIGTELNINDLNYAELANYDFGIWKDPVYAGTKIPTFEEFMKLCRDINLCAYIELKQAGNYTAEDIQHMHDVVCTYGMANKVSYISFNVEYLKLVRECDRTARLGLLISADGVTDANFEKFMWLMNKRTSNFVSVSTGFINNEFITRCVELGLSVEVYCPNKGSAIIALDGRVSGVTSDTLVASEVILDANIGDADTGIV